MNKVDEAYARLKEAVNATTRDSEAWQDEVSNAAVAYIAAREAAPAPELFVKCPDCYGTGKWGNNGEEDHEPCHGSGFVPYAALPAPPIGE